MSNDCFVKRELCPGCGSTKHETVYSCGFLQPPIRDFLVSFYAPQGGIEFGYLNEAEFILDECSECGMIYQREIPNDFLMQKLYEEWINPQKAFDLYVRRNSLDHYSRYAEEVMMLIAYFDTIPSQLKFLDFGMGWGEWCLIAKAFGCDSYGTELSESRIRYAKSNNIKVVSWDKLHDCSFDFINTEQIFEHIPEPLETLRYLKNSLKPEGLIKLSVPYGDDIMKGLKVLDWAAPKGSRNSLNPVIPLEHINCFKRVSIIKMADIAGLKPVKIPLGIQYAFSTNWRPIKRIFKKILRPLYRSVFPKGAYIFFRHG